MVLLQHIKPAGILCFGAGERCPGAGQVAEWGWWWVRSSLGCSRLRRDVVVAPGGPQAWGGGGWRSECSSKARGWRPPEASLSQTNWMSDILTPPAARSTPCSTAFSQELIAAAGFTALTDQTIMPFCVLRLTVCVPYYISHLIVSLSPFSNPLASFLSPVLLRNQTAPSELPYFLKSQYFWCSKCKDISLLGLKSSNSDWPRFCTKLHHFFKVEMVSAWQIVCFIWGAKQVIETALHKAELYIFAKLCTELYIFYVLLLYN